MFLLSVWLLLLLSANAKVLKENELTDNHIQGHFKDDKTVIPDVKNADEDISNSLDDFTKTEVTEPTIDVTEEPEVPKIDNGTALILTPLIKEGRIDEAQRLSEVNPELFLGIPSYSGFLTVNESFNSNLFFWYFPGDRGEDTPWVIWLQGGPGQSSMIGLFQEIGPFFVVGNGTLVPNPYTWLQNHSLVFIDNPVGTGYSFTEHEDGFATDMETYATQLHCAVRQLALLFPELGRAPLYVAGESYAGKYVPALAVEIHNHKDEEPSLNLQGIIVGNGFIDPYLIRDLTRSFYNFGMLGPEQREMARPLLEELQGDIDSGNSFEAKNKFNRLIAIVLAFTRQSHAYNFLRERLPVGKYSHLLAQAHIKRALHVGDIRFSYVNLTVNYRLTADFLSSANHLYETLLEHYDVLAYCGQLDQLLPCVAESENYRRWRWSGAEDFRVSTRNALLHKNRLAGYYKAGGRFTEALILGAGHMTPLDAPAPVRHLVERWTHRLPLDDFPHLTPTLKSYKEIDKNVTTDHTNNTDSLLLI